MRGGHRRRIEVTGCIDRWREGGRERQASDAFTACWKDSACGEMRKAVLMRDNSEEVVRSIGRRTGIRHRAPRVVESAGQTPFELGTDRVARTMHACLGTIDVLDLIVGGAYEYTIAPCLVGDIRYTPSMDFSA